jgi:hypothetical protein
MNSVTGKRLATENVLPRLKGQLYMKKRSKTVIIHKQLPSKHDNREYVHKVCIYLYPTEFHKWTGPDCIFLEWSIIKFGNIRIKLLIHVFSSICIDADRSI